MAQLMDAAPEEQVSPLPKLVLIYKFSISLYPNPSGSDSEDTVADYLHGSSGTVGGNGGPGCGSLSTYQPKSTRYNFCTELGMI